MASDTTLESAEAASVAPPRSPLSGPLSRLLGLALVVLIAGVLTDILLEGWVQQLGGHWSVDSDGKDIYLLADWPKTVKSALYLLLAGATASKIVVDRSWNEFRSKADLALVVLGGVMVVTGLLGGSPARLIGEALFVYFRGVILFYAWRALMPSGRVIRLILTGLLCFISINVAIAIVETVIGYPSYRWWGWTDLTWANLNRAHALLNHPNHLGHVLILTLLGLLAWFLTRESVPRGWWAFFGFLTFGMSATQSRESVVGLGLGVVVLFFLRGRSALKPLAIALAMVFLFTGLQLAVSPQNRAVIVERVKGVFNAFSTPAGSEPPDHCVEGSEGCTEDRRVGKREIRVVFAQQGVRLWVKKPVFGYGVGQFGGVVAFQNNPDWAADLHFNLYGAKPDQVDSFWLHLLVEVGTLGVLAYFVWLFFLIAPMVRSRTRGAGVHPFVLWAPAVLAASLFLGLLSPSFEDPLYPPLLFTVIGLGWVALRSDQLRRRQPGPEPLGAQGQGADQPAENARELAQE